VSGPGAAQLGPPAGPGADQAPRLEPEALDRLRSAVLGLPEVESLPPEDRERLVAGVVGSCVGYLADRAVRAGTRSGDIAARLARAAAHARALAGAIEALDGVGWGLFGRALARVAADEPPAPGAAPVAGTAPAVRCVQRVSAALSAAAGEAGGAPQLSPERSRLLLASAVARAVQASRLALSTQAGGLLDGCTRAAFAAAGVAPPGEMEDLLSRAARVARRTAPPPPAEG
jgi:hypothetical protein